MRIGTSACTCTSAHPRGHPDCPSTAEAQKVGACVRRGFPIQGRSGLVGIVITPHKRITRLGSCEWNLKTTDSERPAGRFLPLKTVIGQKQSSGCVQEIRGDSNLSVWHVRLTFMSIGFQQDCSTSARPE